MEPLRAEAETPTPARLQLPDDDDDEEERFHGWKPLPKDDAPSERADGDGLGLPILLQVAASMARGVEPKRGSSCSEKGEGPRKRPSAAASSGKAPRQQHQQPPWLASPAEGGERCARRRLPRHRLGSTGSFTPPPPGSLEDI